MSNFYELEKSNYLLKHNSRLKKTAKVFSSDIFNFLEQLSKTLISSKLTRHNLDFFSFAIWLRKKNIQNLIKDYDKNKLKNLMPIGQIFHIPSSNIPMSFAYTMVIGVLTGNKNIIRIPEKSLKYAKILSILILKQKKTFSNIIENITFVYFKKNQKLTEKFSLESDGRIFWGSDETINQLKKLNSKTNSRDIFFNDKVSISIINLNKIKNINQKNMDKLCRNFFNDTYLFDQNACTSPKIVIWVGKQNDNIILKFWKTLNKTINKNYLLDDHMVTDKLTSTSIFLAENLNDKHEILNIENNVNIIKCKKINDIKKLNARWGLFYQLHSNNIKNIKLPKSKSYQTISHYGLNTLQKKEIFMNNYLKEFNRVVPIGSTMNFQLTWDGYDLLYFLTKKIEIK